MFLLPHPHFPLTLFRTKLLPFAALWVRVPTSHISPDPLVSPRSLPHLVCQWRSLAASPDSLCTWPLKHHILISPLFRPRPVSRGCLSFLPCLPLPLGLPPSSVLGEGPLCPGVHLLSPAAFSAVCVPGMRECLSLPSAPPLFTSYLLSLLKYF